MPTYPDAFLNDPLVRAYYAQWNELQVDRAALTQKDAEIAALKKRIAELENPPPPPPPPAPTPYDDRVQVIWPAGLVQGPIDSIVNSHDLKRVYACVLAADVQHYIYGPPLIRKLKDNGVKVFAYVRAPVHARVGKQNDYTMGIGPNSPFENQVYELVKRADAWVRNPQGNVMYHPAGYDAYTTPWLIAEQHAKLVQEWVWKLGLFDGILADGLTTNQIYAGGGADYDRDGVADVVKEGWLAICGRQSQTLEKWAIGVDIPVIIGNGAWEPLSLAPSMHSFWTSTDGAWLGAMDEDITHPYYPGGDEARQGPALSQRWEMHRQCAQYWLERNHEYWLGSRCRLFNLPREQELNFCAATALVMGARLVTNEKIPWLSQLYEPTAPATQLPSGAWQRVYRGGTVVCDPIVKVGKVI